MELTAQKIAEQFCRRELYQTSEEWLTEKQNLETQICRLVTQQVKFICPKPSVVKPTCDKCSGKPEKEWINLCGDCFADLHGM